MEAKKGQGIKRTAPQAAVAPRNDRAKAEGSVVRGTKVSYPPSKQKPLR